MSVTLSGTQVVGYIMLGFSSGFFARGIFSISAPVAFGIGLFVIICGASLSTFRPRPT